MSVTILTFYHFAPITDPPAVRDAMQAAMETHGVLGTLLVAPEGINATIAGPGENARAVLAAARALPRFADMTAKESVHDTIPFQRRVVKVRRELISLGAPTEPASRTGAHVPPEEWNALIARPGIRVIDGRNSYEARMGQFVGAEDWGAEDFKDFPDLMREHLPKPQAVAMYCTGGIRCEKLSSYFIEQGITEVYQLDGGILNYLERIPAALSAWSGECYVFDERVAVGHGVAPASKVSFCPACGHPNKDADWSHPLFLPGIRCAHCYD